MGRSPQATKTKTNLAHHRRRRLAGASLAILLGAGAAACSPTGWLPKSGQYAGQYAAPIGGAPVIDNETMYSDALRCLNTYAETTMTRTQQPTVAVGRVLDYTGKDDYATGKKVTQGAGLMAMSALSKAGVRLVERFDIGVSEMELKFANNMLIGDQASNSGYRQILAGSMPGSDYYLVGGITELNYNIRSATAGALYGPVGVKGRVYVLNIGLDLRLVRTETLEVVDLVSYQKQILGREVRAGVFEFFGGEVFDISGGERALEPIQMAVRAVIERAMVEMISGLYGSGTEQCRMLAEAGVQREQSAQAHLQQAELVADPRATGAYGVPGAAQTAPRMPARHASQPSPWTAAQPAPHTAAAARPSSAPEDPYDFTTER